MDGRCSESWKVSPNDARSKVCRFGTPAIRLGIRMRGFYALPFVSVLSPRGGRFRHGPPRGASCLPKAGREGGPQLEFGRIVARVRFAGALIVYEFLDSSQGAPALVSDALHSFASRLNHIEIYFSIVQRNPTVQPTARRSSFPEPQLCQERGRDTPFWELDTARPRHW